MEIVVEGRRVSCPFCSLPVLFIDSECTVLHQAPVCDAFTAKLTQLGLNPERRSWIAITKGDSTEVALEPLKS